MKMFIKKRSLMQCLFLVTINSIMSFFSGKYSLRDVNSMCFQRLFGVATHLAIMETRGPRAFIKWNTNGASRYWYNIWAISITKLDITRRNDLLLYVMNWQIRTLHPCWTSILFASASTLFVPTSQTSAPVNHRFSFTRLFMQCITIPSMNGCTKDYHESILFSKGSVKDIMIHNNVRRGSYVSNGIRHNYPTSTA